MVRMTDAQFKALMDRVDKLEARVGVLERAAILNRPEPPGHRLDDYKRFFEPTWVDPFGTKVTD